MKKMLKLMLTASVSAAVMLASCTEGDLPASPTPPATEDTPVQVELKLKSEQMGIPVPSMKMRLMTLISIFSAIISITTFTIRNTPRRSYSKSSPEPIPFAL